MRELADRAWFRVCRSLGRLLRSARYSAVRDDGAQHVRKYRRFHAPLLVWLGGPLVRILDTGVHVLPQREWEERERALYRSLRGAAIHVADDGALVLPRLAGVTLASLLEDPRLEESRRTKAIRCAVLALVELHELGFTHGDAMAENVLVDVDAGVASWFDFETVHDGARSLTWRRADDVRALLATCLVRTPAGRHADTIQLILDVYDDDGVARLVAAGFHSVWRRPLLFHLGQAPLDYDAFRNAARILDARLGR